MTAVDVVVVGGGLQGLVILRELRRAGYSCALVTNAPLGAGQTLHSHGLLNSGTGLATGALQKELHEITIPYLSGLGVALYGSDRSFLATSGAMVEQLAPAWEANAYRPQPVERASLPLEVDLDATFYRVAGYNLDKRRLVEALAARLERLVVRGDAAGDGTVIEARAAPGAAAPTLRPRAVIVAAGCGTKHVLRDVLGVDGARLDRISFSRSHMICLRGPSNVLPFVGTILSPGGIVVGHPVAEVDGRAIKWYVTPPGSDPAPAADAPGDAVARVDPLVVAAGVEALVATFPALRAAGDRVEATVFAGYKQNLDGQPIVRTCEVVDDDRNVIVALPSVFANAVPNAIEAVSLVRARVEPSGRQVELPAVPDLAVGEVNEDAAGTRWLPWAEFAEGWGVRIA